jgi:hypothetical protein
VAVRKGEDGWGLLQYHLTFDVPNAVAKQVTQLVTAHDKRHNG